MFTMLHLKCFHALGTWDAVGGTGTRVWRGAEDRAQWARFLFPFYFNTWDEILLIPYTGTSGFTKGTGVRTHSRAGCSGARIAGFIWSVGVALRPLAATDLV
jgi:hypothetical protein